MESRATDPSRNVLRTAEDTKTFLWTLPFCALRLYLRRRQKFSGQLKDDVLLGHGDFLHFPSPLRFEKFYDRLDEDFRRGSTGCNSDRIGVRKPGHINIFGGLDEIGRNSAPLSQFSKPV